MHTLYVYVGVYVKCVFIGCTHNMLCMLIVCVRCLYWVYVRYVRYGVILSQLFAHRHKSNFENTMLFSFAVVISVCDITLYSRLPSITALSVAICNL